MNYIYRVIWWLCIFLAVLIWPVCSQEEQDADSEPSDPDIVLPSILLEIEDLSIETIDAVLPEEDELLPPEREVPLPEEEVMEVKEPSPDISIPEFDNTKSTSDDSFVAEALLGAGSVNNILSEISFYKLGQSPRYKLLFSHEMLDGFIFHDAGTGYNLREDSLEGSIKGNPGIMEFDLAGNFHEIERGLQDQSEQYYSHIVRLVEGNVMFSLMPFEKFRISADVNSSLASMSLTGASVPEFNASYPPTEILLSGTLGGEFLFKTGKFGISAEYRYRNLFGDKDYELNRVLAKAYFGIELPLSFILNGNAGYFYNNDIPWLIPFDISLSANPEKTFSFRLAGGYRVEENNLFTLWKDFEYTGFPAPLSGLNALPDNHGWYGDGSMKLNLNDLFILSAGLGFSINSLVYWYNPYAPYESDSSGSEEEMIPDPVTGLFPLLPVTDSIKTSAEAGLRINAARWLSLNLEATGYIFFGEEKTFTWLETLFEGISAEENGNFGGSFSLLFKTDITGLLEFPEFDIALFYKISDNVRIVGEGYDLFSPLLENGRVLRGPYVSPGIRGTLKVHITF
ncbi:MAG: hypothetical protein JXB88_05390 [Spirochaetales bacterium]|nr:hypothetical protein [Spirochaetales bacterium]